MNYPPKLKIIKTNAQDQSLNLKNDQDMKQDIKYQNIIYYKYDGHESITSKDNIKIDFSKAVIEMEKIDWNVEYHHIGFVNKRTNSCLQFVRLDKDEWHADVPIQDERGWIGYIWNCDANTKNVISTLKLFFEEARWFDSLDFVMVRVKMDDRSWVE